MPQVDGETLINLGLQPRQPKRRRVPAPTEAPFIVLRPEAGSMVRVELGGGHSSRGGKPADVASAMIYTHVGEHAPTESLQWTLACNTTRPRCSVAFPVGLRPGTKVWVTACWLSPTAEPGPMSRPVYAYLTGGLRFSLARAA